MILLENNRKALYQWDLNMRVILTNVPAGTEVHYSITNHNMDENCITVVSYSENGCVYANIPNKILQTSGVILVYIYVQDEDKAWTEFETEILVLPRKKPADYVYTETEIKTFESLEKRIENLESTQDPDAIKNAVEDYIKQNPLEETDPTVPQWAKKPEKPNYTAEEVGALPAGTKIPSKTSDLQNDSGFLTEHQDLSGYALKSEVPKSASDVGADAAGTAVAKVSEHNTASNAHNDIRLLVQGLTERLNALADSDDTTLDQMSEVVAYIKSNKSLIDAITTSKVNVSDIIDNLTTNVSNKPLSAAQGVALKTMIDAIATVELDETLTDNTKAAPAGMVGELKGDLNDLRSEFESGSVGGGSGVSKAMAQTLDAVVRAWAYGSPSFATSQEYADFKNAWGIDGSDIPVNPPEADISASFSGGVLTISGVPTITNKSFTNGILSLS